MAQIRPFRGVLYNSRQIQDFARVVSEPYDVINSGQQEDYYRLHPYNIIRLILGKRYPGDNDKNNQYTRADKFFRDWQKQGVLRRDEKEYLYLYEQTFLHNHKRKRRSGFIILLKLEDFAKNTILPHENTFSRPVTDRLELLKTVRANLSPIFALFSDPQEKTNKLISSYKKSHRPYIALEKDGIWHKLWRLGDKQKIAALKKLLKNKQIFIADGHHRYEAALTYRNQMLKKQGPAPGAAFNYVMTYLVATNDPGLAILPTHRALKLKRRWPTAELWRGLKQAFLARKFSSPDQLFAYLARRGRTKGVFGAYFGQRRFWGLRLKNHRRLQSLGGRAWQKFAPAFGCDNPA